MPGYSGTPLAKKLGIKDDFRAALLHVPEDVKTELHDAFAKCRIQNIKNNNKDLDFIFFFAKSRAALALELHAAADTRGFFLLPETSSGRAGLMLAWWTLKCARSRMCGRG